MMQSVSWPGNVEAVVAKEGRSEVLAPHRKAGRGIEEKAADRPFFLDAAGGRRAPGMGAGRANTACNLSIRALARRSR
jgi:hypothetical protein